MKQAEINRLLASLASIATSLGRIAELCEDAAHKKEAETEQWKPTDYRNGEA